jgi:hypothetical protein
MQKSPGLCIRAKLLNGCLGAGCDLSETSKYPVSGQWTGPRRRAARFLWLADFLQRRKKTGRQWLVGRLLVCRKCPEIWILKFFFGDIGFGICLAHAMDKSDSFRRSRCELAG